MNDRNKINLGDFIGNFDKGAFDRNAARIQKERRAELRQENQATAIVLIGFAVIVIGVGLL